jgi:hypothetical protein
MADETPSFARIQEANRPVGPTPTINTEIEVGGGTKNRGSVDGNGSKVTDTILKRFFKPNRKRVERSLDLRSFLYTY